MSDFGRKQLEKFGWKSGEGVGASKQGMTEAIKPCLKFDSAGLGFDAFDGNTFCLDKWAQLYSSAAEQVIKKKKKKSKVKPPPEDDAHEMVPEESESNPKPLLAAVNTRGYSNFVSATPSSENTNSLKELKDGGVKKKKHKRCWLILGGMHKVEQMLMLTILDSLLGVVNSYTNTISILGERKGQNKYYPPDFDPAKHFSLNSYHGVHALRERGKKASEGILVIRFELPFNSWCLTCHKPIAMGVRYNAEKRKVGNYYSTPIYEFKMRCHLCAGDIIMRTDPQHMDYECVAGIRRKEQRWDPATNEQIFADDRATKQKLETDAMFKLAHGEADKEKSRNVAPALVQLHDQNETKRDDFALNQLARNIFRSEKKRHQKQDEADKSLFNRMSLTGGEVKLLPQTEEDTKMAHLLSFQSLQSFEDRKLSERQRISTESIFASSVSSDRNRKRTGPPSSTSSSSSQTKALESKSSQAKRRLLQRMKEGEALLQRRCHPEQGFNVSLVTPNHFGATSVPSKTPALGLVKLVDTASASSENQSRQEESRPLTEDTSSSSVLLVNYDSSASSDAL